MAGAIITGASSGIGQALGRELAGRGWDLALTARRAEPLHALAGDLARRHPGRQVIARVLDVTDAPAVREVTQALFAELGNVELVIANAGIGGSHQVGAGQFERSRAIVVTNLLGAMATVDAAVECWRTQDATGRRRRIVGITSVAGFRGLPGSTAYSASKAGLSTYLEGVRGEVRRLGIDVIDLAPGYIDTPLNQDMASRPFLIDVTDGARRIVDMIEKSVYRSTVPAWPWNIIGWLMRRVPDALWVRTGANVHRGGDR
jgi:short-subunit dehydrogenase